MITDTVFWNNFMIEKKTLGTKQISESYASERAFKSTIKLCGKRKQSAWVRAQEKGKLL